MLHDSATLKSTQPRRPDRRKMLLLDPERWRLHFPLPLEKRLSRTAYRVLGEASAENGPAKRGKHDRRCRNGIKRWRGYAGGPTFRAPCLVAYNFAQHREWYSRPCKNGEKLIKRHQEHLVPEGGFWHKASAGQHGEREQCSVAKVRHGQCRRRFNERFALDYPRSGDVPAGLSRQLTVVANSQVSHYLVSLIRESEITFLLLLFHRSGLIVIDKATLPL